MKKVILTAIIAFAAAGVVFARDATAHRRTAINGGHYHNGAYCGGHH